MNLTVKFCRDSLKDIVGICNKRMTEILGRKDDIDFLVFEKVMTIADKALSVLDKEPETAKQEEISDTTEDNVSKEGTIGSMKEVYDDNRDLTGYLSPDFTLFDSVRTLCSGRMAVFTLDGKAGFADCNGNLVIPPIYDDVCDFSTPENAEKASALVKRDYEWIHIDINGNEIKDKD